MRNERIKSNATQPVSATKPTLYVVICGPNMQSARGNQFVCREPRFSICRISSEHDSAEQELPIAPASTSRARLRIDHRFANLGSMSIVCIR